MAQIHNEIRKGWLSEAVNRALGRTREGGVERVSETCDVVMNPWGMPEWAYLRAEMLCGLRRSVAAGGAATFGGAALCNTTPGLIVTVEASSVLGVAAGGTALDWYLAADADLVVALGASQLGMVRDTRWLPSATRTSQAVVRYGTPAAGTVVRGPVESTIFPAANTMVVAVTCLPVVLHPGQALVAFLRTANIAIEVNFGWRERKAYPGEL